MAGPQFFHLQSYARKANKAGQCIAQVLGEAARDPLYSHHVAEPQPCRVVYGLSPAEVHKRHDEMIAQGEVTVTLKNGKTARRGIRQDRHTMLTAVASHPNLTSQLQANPAARAEYEEWLARNIAYLRKLFGDQLVSVIEHIDEEHPHIHAYIMPLDDLNCSARDLNPCWVAKTDGEAQARQEGGDDKAAVKAGNTAYREQARLLQDQYHREVGLASGLTRTGPKRERLSRSQWRARKAEAVLAAKSLQLIDERDEAVTATADRLAVELATKLDQIDALFFEAETERGEAAALLVTVKGEADDIRLSAEDEAEQIVEAARRLERDNAVQTAILDRRDQDLEQQRRRLAHTVGQEVSTIVLSVVSGVISGDVSLSADGQDLNIRDDRLRDQIRRFHLLDALIGVAAKVSAVWERLTSRLSRFDIANEQERAKSITPESDTGLQPRNYGYEP